MVDPVHQFVPWLGLIRRDISSGQLPLWNPYSFSGSPLFANGQSATLSPFTGLALLFSDPAQGYSLSMLTKLVVAAVGMAIFVCQLGGRGVSAAFGGLAFASSGFMVVWLGHPHTAVAAIIPWAFASAEWYLRTGDRRALAGVAIAVALQFFAGHEETSFHLCLFLAAWVAVRSLVQSDGRLRKFAALSAATVLGATLSAVQLVPFLSDLRSSTLAADRERSSTGLASLSLNELSSWVIPNGHGNPGIDHLVGRFPNYAESTAFIGVGALLLVTPGLALLWRTARSAGLLLAGGLLFSILTVHGEITNAVGRLPGFKDANNVRLIGLACFCAAVAAGMGLEMLLRIRARRVARSLVSSFLVLAVLGILGLGTCALTLRRDGAGVDTFVGAVHGQLGFWVIVFGLSAGTAILLLAAGLTGVVPRYVGVGYLALALMEAVLFAVPFQPRTARSDNPPPSAVMDWLKSHAGTSSIAAHGVDAIPNQSVTYGITDTRGTDVLFSPRLRTYWGHADPGYVDAYTQLTDPREAWLAAAGVRYYVSSPDHTLPGTSARFTGYQTVVSELPNARPFAFAVSLSSVAHVPDAESGANLMAVDPLGPIVVEGCCASKQQPSPGPTLIPVGVESRGQNSVRLNVDMPSAGLVVVLQSYDRGWSASVDGSRVDVRPADVLFQGVALPAGRHTVVLDYRPEGFVLGAVLSGISAAIIVLMTMPIGVRRRLSEPTLAVIRLLRRERNEPSTE